MSMCRFELRKQRNAIWAVIVNCLKFKAIHQTSLSYVVKQRDDRTTVRNSLVLYNSKFGIWCLYKSTPYAQKPPNFPGDV